MYAVGIPATLNLALPSLLISCLNIILSAYSQVYVLVLGVYYKLQTFLYLPANGIVQGMRPIIGYNFGAKSMPEWKNIPCGPFPLCGHHGCWHFTVLGPARAVDGVVLNQWGYHRSRQHGPAHYQHWLYCFFYFDHFLRRIGRVRHGNALFGNFLDPVRCADYSGRFSFKPILGSPWRVARILDYGSGHSRNCVWSLSEKSAYARCSHGQKE